MQSGLGSKIACARHKDVLEASIPSDLGGRKKLVEEIKRRGNAAFKAKACQRPLPCTVVRSKYATLKPHFGKSLRGTLHNGEL